MKLKSWMAIFVGLLLLLFAGLSLSLIRIVDLLDESGRELSIAAESIWLAEELKSDLLTHNRNALLRSIGANGRRALDRQAQRAEIAMTLAELEERAISDEERVSLRELNAGIARYLDARARLGEEGLPPLVEYERISSQVDRTLAIVNRLIALNRLHMRQVSAQIDDRNQLAMVMGIILLLGGGVVLVWLIASIVRSIARPLSRLSQSVERYGAGQHYQRAETQGLGEIVEIARQFNRMAERLEERRQDQLRFVASIAHDLRNPLHSIALISELLVEKSSKPERKMAETVLRQVLHLDQLVQDLLDTSRIEAGQLELDKSTFDVREAIQDAVELYRSSADLHHLSLHLPAQPLLCHCDRSRLSQVLNNLLSNAVKYSPNGGNIHVQADIVDGELWASVSDQGIGIPASELENIFRPFHRTQLTRGLIPGIGLGLSASRRIIEAHGGRLEVESREGRGSTFRVFLPTDSPESGDQHGFT